MMTYNRAILGSEISKNTHLNCMFLITVYEVRRLLNLAAKEEILI